MEGASAGPDAPLPADRVCSGWVRARGDDTRMGGTSPRATGGMGDSPSPARIHVGLSEGEDSAVDRAGEVGKCPTGADRAGVAKASTRAVSVALSERRCRPVAAARARPKLQASPLARTCPAEGGLVNADPSKGDAEAGLGFEED